MELIGQWIIYLVMACAVLGAVASLIDDEKGLGKEFLEGLRAIGPIFIPVAGIMASLPYLSRLIEHLIGPAFASIGASPAIAATSIIAVDMGGYQLARTLATSHENWIMAMVVGYMAGATIVFSIPVGLAMLEKKDHKYLALGMMSGILSVPVGVLVATSLMALFTPTVRDVISTQGASNYGLTLSFSTIFSNIIPLVVFVSAIAAGLRFFPDKMIRGFMVFAKTMDVFIRLVLVASIVEYFTGGLTKIFGYWGFLPIIADEKDQFRALELAGYIGIMLSGAFPMVYLIHRYLSSPIQKIGSKLGLEAVGAAGLLASIANILAMFRLIKDMRPKDKVLNIAFAVCAAFLFGDHLSFTANFQPNLIVPIMVGKLSGGIFAFFIAYKLSVPKALEFERATL